MSAVHHNFIQSAATLTRIAQERRLKKTAVQLIADYPDVYGLAYAEARTIVRKHLHAPLDPAAVYWHRFSNARSSARTFTGWDHVGPPVESLTLVELVMHRFSAHDQEATDELQVYGGFYTDGPEHGVYDERNEVALLPADVLKDFWALDFSTLYRLRRDAFWTAHGDNMAALARGRFLAAAGLQRRDGSLAEEDFRLLVDASIGELPAVMTLSALQASHQPQAGTTVRTFDIGGRLSSEMVRVVGADGRQILYVPGEQPAFHAFRSGAELYQWVQARVATEQSASSLEKLVLRSQAGRALHGREFQGFVQRLRSQPFNPARRIVNQHDYEIKDDIFIYLRDIAHREMDDDARALLVSNASLRKQMWIGYLDAFIHVFGPTTLLGWPVALTLIGAAACNLALNVDQATHGRTARQRKAGMIGAICNSIFMVFNLPMLAGVARVGELTIGEEQAGIARDGASVDTLESGTTTSREAIELVDLPLPGEPGSQIQTTSRQANELAGPQVPVRSAFWDTYMQFNLQDEERFSRLGLARQEELLSLRVAEPNASLSADSQGHEVYLDAWGDEYKVFRTSDGRYVSGSLPLYTSRSEAFNQFLRTGVSDSPQQVQLIRQLDMDLLAIGRNNDVPLYRGGSAARGTSGVAYRGGQIRQGDVLVNTDVTSFSENPYMARVFASSQAGHESAGFVGEITFDDSAVVFELPARSYLSATPIAPFSGEEQEVESLFMPGNYFEIQRIREVHGLNYKFMHVELMEIARPRPGQAVYDLRTGRPFSRAHYADMLGAEGAELVDRFFPLRD